MTTTVLDIEETLRQLKIEGNKCFKQQDYTNAIKFYTQGIDHKIYEDEISDITPLIELRQGLLLNRSKSHFKLNHLKYALIDSAECIRSTHKTLLFYKAHFCRAEIYKTIGDFKNAISHCDQILNHNNSSLNMSALLSRAKKLKIQIKEQSLLKSSKKSKKHRSRRPNNILNAMSMSMGEHRQRIETIQRQKPPSNSNSNTVALVVSSKWWRKWYNLDGNAKLNEIDMNILIVDNSNLTNVDHKEDEKQQRPIDTIAISSVYLDYNLRPNLSLGLRNDFIILKFSAFQEMVKMGYKIQPPIWVKTSDNNSIELYKTQFTILYNDKYVHLLSSINETIRKVATEIARHFVIQSSSIRLRYKNANGAILDRSHTLAQHELDIDKIIYVEMRLPNGCWPINHKTDKYIKKKSEQDTIICHACHRIISHYVNCTQCDEGIHGAKYCNRRHLCAHLEYHNLEHKMDLRVTGRFGICGLDNLGNSCYMNSSLQCLSSIAELRSYLICNDYLADINTDNPLGHKGALSKIFARFLQKMWFGLNPTVSPKPMRHAIAQLHSQWNTDQQQDAEEFLTWLLDGLHEDLNLIHDKPYYELADSNNRLDEIVANEHWTLHLKRNQSIIVDLFQGQYKSTLQCPCCDNISVKFDPFSSLTLPIPDKDSMLSVTCLVFPADSANPFPFKLTVNVSEKAVGTQLTDVLREKLKGKLHGEYELLICKVIENKFGKYWSCSRPVKKVVSTNRNYTYIYQTKTKTIAKRKQDDLVQVRMNFCYKLQEAPSSSSGGSDDNLQVLKVNNNALGGDKRIFFAHPMVFDVLLTEFTGNNMYEIFKRRFKSFCRRKGKGKDVSESKEEEMALIHMYLRKEGADKEIDIDSDERIALTNDSRNVATVNVEFSEYEYKLYVDRLLAVYDEDFDKLSDAKPKNGIDIYDCLKLYTAAEVLDDIVWKCPKCLKKGQPSKQLHLWRLPEILIIHLKRFLNQRSFYGGGIGRKIDLNIKAPINGLDLREYIATTSNLPNDLPKYDLFATLNHHGMMHFGHYYSIIRTDRSTRITNFYQHYKETDPVWNLFNDEKVERINIDELEDYAKQTYLLFYRRRNNV